MFIYMICCAVNCYVVFICDVWLAMAIWCYLKLSGALWGYLVQAGNPIRAKNVVFCNLFIRRGAGFTLTSFKNRLSEFF